MKRKDEVELRRATRLALRQARKHGDAASFYWFARNRLWHALENAAKGVFTDETKAFLLATRGSLYSTGNGLDEGTAKLRRQLNDLATLLRVNG